MTAEVLQTPVLVLNRNWQAVNTIPVKRALRLLFKENAKIIEPETFETHTLESWADLKLIEGQSNLSTVGLSFRIPEIISVLKYSKLPIRKTIFSRANIYKRDKFTCQYCGAKPGTPELSVDHIFPKSRGGKSSWTNCVLACIDCNRKKSSKTLKQCGMKLLSDPIVPPWDPIFTFKLWKKPQSWQKFISAKYWETELIN